MTITAAALLVGCSRQTASKWVRRQRRGEGLADRSSRPRRSPRRTPAGVEQAVLQRRRASRLGPHPIGWELGLAASTVHAILHRHGLSHLNPPTREPVVRYQRERPGELLHIDVKRLGRIQRPRDPSARSNRGRPVEPPHIAVNPPGRTQGPGAPAPGRPYGAKAKAGWDSLFVCVDAPPRLPPPRPSPAETTAAALHFLNDCR